MKTTWRSKHGFTHSIKVISPNIKFNSLIRNRQCITQFLCPLQQRIIQILLRYHNPHLNLPKRKSGVSIQNGISYFIDAITKSKTWFRYHFITKLMAINEKQRTPRIAQKTQIEKKPQAEKNDFNMSKIVTNDRVQRGI